jgi:hypothetical protein
MSGMYDCDARHRRKRRPAERAALIEARLQNFILDAPQQPKT